jgi:hypothetical protein
MTALALALLVQAAEDSRPLPIDGAPAAVRSATVAGPRFVAPELFQGHEDFHHPRLRRMREENRLDEVVRGEASEFRRQLKLRNWVHRQWPIDNAQNFGGDAFAILEKARQDGAGFHCAHSMTVQYAVLTSMGYVARNLGTDADHERFGKSLHHGVNEVWSNELAKWVLLDAKYDVHFERAGRPLSALEVHDAVRSGKAGELVTVKGIDRAPVALGGPDTVEAAPTNYWWVSWHVRTDSFTQPHWSGGSRLVVPDNEAFRTTVWHRGGADGLRKHWAYAANAFLPARDPRQIEWTPNVTSVRASASGDAALELRFSSATPNFRRYETRVPGGPWTPAEGERKAWKLEKGENRLEARAVNLFEVAGPAVSLRVLFEP